MIFKPQVEIPNLAPDEVHLWLAKVGADLKDHLSNDEITRASKYHKQIDRLRYRSARSALRKILGSYLSIDPSKIHLELNRHGKPMLAEKFHEPIIEFNLSHSDQLLLFAFSRERRVGVDMEHIRPFPELTRLVSRYFTENEASAITSIPKQERIYAFFSGWTRKEALLKAIGKGLRVPLNTIEVSLDPHEADPQHYFPQNPREESYWRLISFAPAEEYIAALAVEGRDWKTKPYKLV